MLRMFQNMGHGNYDWIVFERSGMFYILLRRCSTLVSGGFIPLVPGGFIPLVPGGF